MRVETTLQHAGESLGVVIHATDDATGADFLAACARYLTIGEPIEATSVRTGEQVIADAPLRSAGLVHGDRIEIAPPERASISLRAASPADEWMFELTEGPHIIGRSAGRADVVVPHDTVGRTHCRVDVGPDGEAVLVDLGSSNGTYQRGVAIGGSIPLTVGDQFEAGLVEFTVVAATARRQAPPARAMRVDGSGRVEFHRSPRDLPRIDPLDIRVPAAPATPPPRRVPIAASLVPLVAGLLLWVITKSVASLALSVVAPILAVGSYLEDRRSGRRSYSDRRAKYNTEVAEIRAQWQQALDDESRALHRAAPEPGELIERAVGIDARLWERRPDHADFLVLRLGLGSVLPSTAHRVTTTSSDDETRALQAELTAARITDVPVGIDLLAHQIVGVHGSPEALDCVARLVELQVRVLHGPADADVCEWRPGTIIAATVPYHVMIVRDSLDLDRREVLALLEGSGNDRTRLVWLAPARRSLPGNCTAVVHVDQSSVTVAIDGGGTPAVCQLDHIAAADVAQALTALEGVTDADAGSQSTLARRVGLLDLLGLNDVTANAVLSRWSSDSGAVVTPIGRSASGAVVLDLRRDGPHLLIAGTTGAGKSELLQSLVAGLAAARPPQRTSFLLVDYKGGAAFKGLAELPHTVGFVTDLDGHLSRRALIALDSEIKRRERLVFEHGAKDLAELERLDLEAAPPSLLVVIDEFATLVQEVPQFVDGVVDLAQRGRSLGLHLVLATQRPAGVVSDRIRANVSARIALRVADAQDSSDVIGSPQASQISRDIPGRAFLRVGRDEPIELQTAWSGDTSSAAAGGEPAGPNVVIVAAGVEAPGAATEAGLTDLQRLSAAIRSAFQQQGLPEPRRPWLSPLPPEVLLEELPASDDEGSVIVALSDDPAAQAQPPLAIDLRRGGAVVYGTARSGLTTFLRTTALAAVRGRSPADVQIYGIDFGRGLVVLEDLPHVGSVVAGDDPERVVRLLHRLRTELHHRRERLAEARIATIEGLRQQGEEVPRIILLLDDFGAFATAFERVDLGRPIEQFVALVSQGASVGIHVVITATRRASVPGSLGSVLTTRLALRVAEREELTMLGVDRDLARTITFVPGRGIDVDSGLEFQTAVAAHGNAEFDAIRQIGDAARRAWPGVVAPPVRSMPSHVGIDALASTDDVWQAPVGIAGDAESTVQVDLADAHVLVVGPHRSGRSTALHAIASAALVTGAECWLVAGRRSPLLTVGGWRRKASGDDCSPLLVDLEATVSRRDSSAPPLLVIVDDVEELSTDASILLETIVRRGRDRNVRVAISSEVRSAHRAFSGPVAEIRKFKSGILLRPEPDVDGDLFSVRLPRSDGRPVPPGRGYVVAAGSFELVQIAMSGGEGLTERPDQVTD